MKNGINLKDFLNKKKKYLFFLIPITLICLSCFNENRCANSLDLKEKTYDSPNGLSEDKFDCSGSDSIFIRFTSGFENTKYKLFLQNKEIEKKTLNTDIYSQAGNTQVEKAKLKSYMIYFDDKCIGLKELNIPDSGCRVIIRLDSDTLIVSYGDAYPFIM